MIVLLIGPSGVGKTTYGKYASTSVSDCCFYDLDERVKEHTGKGALQLFRKGPDSLLEACKSIVDALAARCAERLCLVAVGAGALQSERALEWLRGRVSIAILAPPEEVQKRRELWRQKGLEAFKHSEYSPDRLQIYDAATHQLCVGGVAIHGPATAGAH